MSFILDALKKSEAERQRQAAPGFADIPHGPERPRPPRWLWVVAGLLAINVVVLLAVFFLPGADTPAPIPVAEQPAAQPPAARDSEQPFAAIVAAARQNRPEEDAPTTTEPPRDDPMPAAADPSIAETAEPAETHRGTVTDSPATFEALRADGTLQLPDLHLDIHVYSDKPAERFAFINMSKYAERDTLAEGPRIREITPDGVILEQAGTVFLLPRR